MGIADVQRTRLVTIAILTLVFGAGVLLGLVVERSLFATPPATATPTASAADSLAAGEEDGERHYMFEEVGLTPDQRAVIDSMVLVHRGRMSALRKAFSEEYDPRFRAIVESTREAIKGAMTPVQAAMYDSIASVRDRQRAAEDSASGGRSRR